MMWSQSLLLLAVATYTTAAGYCSVNTLVSNSSWMQFTKEPVPLEYGFENKFKSIHCCVKAYRSIEWFKDGVAYPWSAGVSNLILYPEAANQTLYTQHAARADSGNYTCRTTNETHSSTHTVRLDILEKPLDVPKIMFISKDQWVEEGADLRLYCEALIGRSYLADARSDLRWMKIWPNSTEGDLLPTQSEIKTTRDDVEDIIGSYLNFGRVSAQDYGSYACVIHSNDVVSKNYVTVHYQLAGSSVWSSSGVVAVPWRAVVLCIACVALCAASLAAAHRRCTPRLMLAARQARANRSAAHRARVLEKEFDVLVCWTAVDAELVRGALIPTLSLKYKYRVHAVQISESPDNWYKEIMSEMGRCRSALCVVSPAQYASAPQQLLAAFRQLGALPAPPVVVLLQVQ
ncbi:hypothetical protein ACJJTC_001302 [Scirpophaga incertulas]